MSKEYSSEEHALAKSPERQQPTPSGGEAVACGGSAELTADGISRLRPPDEARVEVILERPAYFRDIMPRESDQMLVEAPYPASARRDETGPAAALSGPTVLPQTPPPVASWQASGGLSALAGFPSDAQLAVSTTHVVVTARAVIAFYNKAGQLLRPPIPTGDFFSSLNLQQQFGINYYFDTRAIFDAYRRRFWVAALGKNTANTSETTKFVVGISRTENPLEPVHNLFNNRARNASTIMERLVASSLSQFFQSLRHFSSQANDRSTTHRFGITAKV